MTKQRLEHLINRYIQGNATKEEEEVVEEFYAHLVAGSEELKTDNEHDKNQLKERMYNNIQGHIRRSQRMKYRYFISTAAAVLVLLISGYFYMNRSAMEIAVIADQSKEIQVTTETDQRSLLLHDGSYVLLSPGATISYPVAFDDRVRNVRLSGEAWFDVQRDTTRPFQVISNEVTTTVLGTSFSINANPNNADVEVRVTSGRVQVNSLDQELAVLEKDDQLVYQSGEVEVTRKMHKVEKKLPEPGAFKLANVTMEEAAMFLEKRWHKEITFENETIRDCPLYASFNAHDTQEEVLMILCGVSNSKHKLENGKIVIYGNGCVRE